MIVKRKRKREKERAKRKKKEEEEKEQWPGCTLGFYNNYFEDSCWPKKIAARKRSICG